MRVTVEVNVSMSARMASSWSPRSLAAPAPVRFAALARISDVWTEDMANPFFQQGSFPKRGCPSCVPMSGQAAYATRASRNQRCARAFQGETGEASPRIKRNGPARALNPEGETHASQIGRSAKGRRRGVGRKARQAQGELAQSASRSMYESMNERQLDELASTRREGKPEHVSGSPVKE